MALEIEFLSETLSELLQDIQKIDIERDEF